MANELKWRNEEQANPFLFFCCLWPAALIVNTQQFDRPACEHATGKPSLITAWFYEWFKTNVRPASRSHSNDSWFKRATPARKNLRQK